MDCNETMDWLDEASAEQLERLPVSVREHIQKCGDCERYYRVSMGLKRLDGTVPEMWHAFERKLDKSADLSRKRTIRYAFTALAASLVIVLGITLLPTADGEQETVVSYPYSDTLDYAGELSTGRNYNSGEYDALEASYELAINY